MPVTVTKSGPGVVKLERDLERIRKSEVYVGIPAAKVNRPGEPINNASLLWLHSKGSPLKRIPPRPVLEPSIIVNKNLITPHLGAAAKAVLENDPQTAQNELEKAGTIAANGAKRYVLQGDNLAPNAPSTIKRKGSDRPLIDTARMIGAVTYVVRAGDQ